MVCVAPEHAKGTADYARFVRKHRNYFALTATGEIESGVSHVDPRLSPFGPPPVVAFADLAREMLARTTRRDDVRAAWRIGEPYLDREVQTIRVRPARHIGIPALRQMRHAPPSWDGARVRWLVATVLGVAAVTGVMGAVLATALVGAGLAAVTGAGGIAWLAHRAREPMARLTTTDTLEDLGSAVAEALAKTGVTTSTHGASSLRVSPQPDGFYRCYLDGASEADASTFALALDELLAPLFDPKAIIARRVAEPPTGTVAVIGMAARRLVRRGPGALVVWHAVPSVLASSRARLAAFEHAWSRWVDPGARALRSDDPRAAGVLAVRTGDDPFGVESQMRTLWT